MSETYSKIILMFATVSTLFSTSLLFSAGRSVRPFNCSVTVNADTSSFTPNNSQGWSKLKVYLNSPLPDSVDFEIILVRTSGMLGNTEFFVGSITNASFLPAAEQLVNYQLLFGNTWNIRIKTNGQVFIQHTTGSFIPGDPSILPVKIKYKRT